MLYFRDMHRVRGGDYTVDNTNAISDVRGSGRTSREVSLHAVDQSVKRNRSVTFLFTARLD
jgi:hypothetical protein